MFKSQGLRKQGRRRVARTVNSELVLLYGKIGGIIRQDIPGGDRAAYGEEIVSTVSRQRQPPHCYLRTMDGSPPIGRVPAVDQDRLFKELLTTLFFEFLDPFFPRLAAQVDRESIEFLSQELFPDLLDGAEYRADILVKARFKGQDAWLK